MNKPNLLIISNNFVPEDLDESLNGRIITWNEETLWSPSDRDVVIIDVSFNNEKEAIVSAIVYDEIIVTRLSSTEGRLIAKGLIVIIICGYSGNELRLSFPLKSPPEERPFEEERYLPADAPERRETYEFLKELLGTLIYNRLRFQKVENYERRKVKSLFKEYFKFTDNIIAHLSLEEDLSNPDSRIEAISKTGGVERNFYVSAIIRIGKGSIILLPGYNQSRKREAFLALIKISNELYNRTRRWYGFLFRLYNFFKKFFNWYNSFKDFLSVIRKAFIFC